MSQSGNIISKSVVSRRRNGQQAACEPCRKGKIRCDHASPVCSRCKKRRTPAQCVFLPAPMTQTIPSKLSSSKPLSPPSIQLSSPTSRIEICHFGTSDELEPISESHGFLGSTSFSATIQHGNLTEESEGQSVQEALVSGYTSEISSSAHLQLAIKVLRQLPTEQTCHCLLDWYMTNLAEMGFHEASIRVSLEALWSTFGKLLSDPRSSTDLHSLAKTIFRNASVPLKLEGPEDAIEWIATFSGPNTRWETLGMLFLAFSYALLSLPENEMSKLFGERAENKQELIAEMKDCVEACIELCRSSLNTLVCNLLYTNMLLETVLRGDASLSAWRLHNELIGTAVAYGLHCYQGGATITAQSEMTKRLSGCIFWSDKELSMFTGRPPSLSHRYYSCPLPLDLNDDTLMAGGQLLEDEINSLDENGWNTQGRIFNATLCRMSVQHAFIQDDIMELFIGNQAQWSQQRLEDLKVRAREVYSKFPMQLQVTKKDFIHCPDNKVMWQLLCGRLDYLKIHLLLERLSTERGGASKRELFDVAREMLDLTAFLWVHRDRSSSRAHDYDYMIMGYGMPSIGILCAELLKQVKHPEQVEVKLPVSETVQNLSLMIGFLDWIRPAAGNYKLCRPLSQVIRRVLDQLFEPASVEALRSKESSQQVEMSNDVWPLDNLDDLEWLNTIDWTLGRYMDFS